MMFMITAKTQEGVLLSRNAVVDGVCMTDALATFFEKVMGEGSIHELHVVEIEQEIH